MSIRRSRVVCRALTAALGALLFFVSVAGPLTRSAGAADPASASAAQAAVAWLIGQQQSDGGFELAGFPGFETPDAVLAIAEAAQTGAAWDAAAARAAVEALHFGGSGGPTPLDALDDFVDGGITAGQAAKLILLVVAPLGLDAEDFDPSADSPAPVDLVAMLDPLKCAGNPASYGFFNQTLFGALAKAVLCGAPNPAVVETIRDAQRADGGWNFLGDPDDVPVPVDSDVDTTAFALQALIASGAAWNDPAVLGGLRFLAGQQSDTGAFVAFGSDDPNATAVAMVAVAAAGFDPGTPCWRDVVLPEQAGTPYTDPSAWLRTQQQPDGRVASPNDGFGINTFATAQAVQGWLRSWLPIVRATGAPDCAPAATPGGGAPAAAVELIPRFTG